MIQQPVIVFFELNIRQIQVCRELEAWNKIKYVQHRPIRQQIRDEGDDQTHTLLKSAGSVLKEHAVAASGASVDTVEHVEIHQELQKRTDHVAQHQNPQLMMRLLQFFRGCC